MAAGWNRGSRSPDNGRKLCAGCGAVKRWGQGADTEFAMKTVRYVDGSTTRKPTKLCKDCHRLRLRRRDRKRSDRLVDPKAFMDWLSEYQALTGRTDSYIDRAGGRELSRTLRKLRKREYERIGVDFVDEVATALGQPFLASVLYPLDP